MAENKINIKINAKDNTKGVLRGVTSGFAKMGAAIGAFISARAIVGFAKSSIDAFMKQEDAVNSLAAALRNNGDDVSNLVPQYQKFASAVQSVTKYGDEGTLEIMAYGRNLGITTDQLEDATKAAIGLAAKFKLDLRTSMMLVGRASQGQTQMLTRYGITLDDTLDTQGKFNALLKIGGSNFKLAADDAGTLAGRLEQAKNAYGDMKENIGGAIAEGFDLATMFDDIALNIQAANEAGNFKEWAGDLAALKEGLAPIAKLFGNVRDSIKGIAGGLGSLAGGGTFGEGFQTGLYESDVRKAQRAEQTKKLRAQREKTLEGFVGAPAEAVPIPAAAVATPAPQNDASNRDILEAILKTNDAINGLRQK